MIICSTSDCFCYLQYPHDAVVNAINKSRTKGKIIDMIIMMTLYHIERKYTYIAIYAYIVQIY